MTATSSNAIAAVGTTVIGTTADPVAGSIALAGIVLAAVFTVAAVLKLRSPATTADEFTSLAVPLPRIAARVVPIAELAIAAALLTRPAVGGPAAVIVLAVFTAVLVRVVRSGRTVSCGCLGALDRGPVSTATIARNGLFIALATTVVFGSRGTASTGSIVAVPTASLAVQILVVAGSIAVIAFTITQLLVLRRRIGRIWSVALAGETDRQAGADHSLADIAHTDHAGSAVNGSTNPSAIDGPTPGSTLEVLAT